jgi:hypothetical protein
MAILSVAHTTMRAVHVDSRTRKIPVKTGLVVPVGTARIAQQAYRCAFAISVRSTCRECITGRGQQGRPFGHSLY